MKQIQLVGITPEENNAPIFEYIDKKFDDLKKFYQPKEPAEFLTRNEVSKMLKMDISSVHNLTVKGILQKYQISGRVLYQRKEVLDSIVKLKK
jgi:hypothetical protein